MSAPRRCTILPQSVLTLDDNGVLGIRTVEDGNKVAFHAVTIIKDTRDGVWVVGLPFKINVITVGQEFVQPGQIVDAKTDDRLTREARSGAVMMNFLERILRMPRVVLTVMVGLLVAGVLSYMSLPKESFPAIDIPYFYISVSQTGVSPADAERLLGKPIEDRVKDVDGLVNYTTTASHGPRLGAARVRRQRQQGQGALRRARQARRRHRASCRPTRRRRR